MVPTVFGAFESAANLIKPQFVSRENSLAVGKSVVALPNVMLSARTCTGSSQPAIGALVEIAIGVGPALELAVGLAIGSESLPRELTRTKEPIIKNPSTAKLTNRLRIWRWARRSCCRAILARASSRSLLVGTIHHSTLP